MSMSSSGRAIFDVYNLWTSGVQEGVATAVLLAQLPLPCQWRGSDGIATAACHCRSVPPRPPCGLERTPGRLHLTIFAVPPSYHDSMDSSMWDRRYEGAELMWSASPNLFLPPLVAGVPPGTALDVACGEGRNAIWLATQGWDVTAFDFSAVGIDKARQLAGEIPVEWVVANATTFEPTKKFDLVVIFYLHLPETETTQAFARAVNAVAAGGTLFAVGHALSNIEHGVGGPPYPEILWTADRMAPLVEGLEVIELGERERYVESADATAIDLVVWATKPQ